MHLNEIENDDSYEHNFSGEEEKDDPRKYDSDLPAPLPLFGSGENEIAEAALREATPVKWGTGLPMMSNPPEFIDEVEPYEPIA